MILAVQRPDERKNLETLIRAYGESDSLRELANLVLLVGTRDDIDTVPKGQRKVLQQMLRLIDRYDLYGSVAYPKQHSSEDIAEIYRLAASRRGVFVNPALTEPFGLTLIEAAASGLPIVATNDGGPQEIVRICNNGVLIDPLDADALAESLLEVLSDRHQWRRQGSRRHPRGGPQLLLEGARCAVSEADQAAAAEATQNDHRPTCSDGAGGPTAGVRYRQHVDRGSRGSRRVLVVARCPPPPGRFRCSHRTGAGANADRP